MKFAPEFAVGMESEAQVPDYVQDALDGLMDNMRADTCMASHGVDFALAIALKNANSARDFAAHLSYIVHELTIARDNVRKVAEREVAK